MAWVNFDDVLLDIYYTNFAIGGPEFSTALIDSQMGLEQARINRWDYISRYTIEYQSLKNQRRKDLRTFHLLRWGMAYGFRFLAPDDSTDDGKGVFLNAALVEVASLVGGQTYYLAKKYEDVRTYYRRIVKPQAGSIQLRYAGAPAAAVLNPAIGSIVPAVSGDAASWIGTFHLPVRFTTDFNEMKTDETTNSEWSGVGLRELLPIALGITI